MGSCTIKVNKKALWLFLIIFSLTVFAKQTRVYALKEESFSTEEKVAMAYFKLGDVINPDFTLLIKQSEKYRTKKPSEKVRYLSRQQATLEQAFIHYVPEFGMIEMEVPATIEGFSRQELVTAHQYNEYFLTLSLEENEREEGVFFPIYIGDRWIAFIPRGMDAFKTMQLSREEYMKWEEEMLFTTKPKRNIQIKLIIQPIFADTNEPITIKDTEMWLMMGEIASLSLWKNIKKDELLYQYTAPWYVSAETQELMLLYKK